MTEIKTWKERIEAETMVTPAYIRTRMEAEIADLRTELARLDAALKERGAPVAWADDAAISGRVGNVCSTAAKRYWEKSDWVDRKNAELHKHPLFTYPAQPSQDEPYAWAWDEATYMGGDVRGSQWRSKMGKHKPTNDWMTRNVTALYLHPAQPREPMTQDEIDKDLAQVIGDYPRKEGNPVGKLNWYRSLYKRAEAFHHIGEKSE